ncbi:WD domain-containing protein [Aspergillus ellipticus CBS 707.79]|uniref:WD domain-containing protein n=1 Tax=Aspergillus ellipticus CBS 707.79 TaxID=1448320 RepID=A0A319EF40_9EURO|nr:WD domain-containing protein [Aspergillus ellipticus CBS 707.79]
MTTDSLSYHPTESLILPTKRRFFPLKIPNFHQQLRNYISTADPDRIYVVVEKLIYAIHISSQKRETIAEIPFEPKCLAAAHGWIGVGGSDNGECAFIRLSDRSARARADTPAFQPSDVDSALPIDLEPPARLSPPWLPGDEPGTARSSGRRQIPELQLHKFGGSIVNSVTIHRLPGDGKDLVDEDIAILSNNDKTVTIFSLARSKVLKVLLHPSCMNYAIMSPDSTVLTAVGDETRAYFYDVTRNLDQVALTENGDRLCGWNWDLLRCIEMDIGTRFDDGCCFTIAFSQFSRLCAIGSQSGVITIFDLMTIRDIIREPHGKNTIICRFDSSRPCCNGGAVRCMTFAPEPWDLLVWLEDKGRAGIADARQGFVRRQILQLDMNEPGIEEVRTELSMDDLAFELSDRISPNLRHELDATQRLALDSFEGPPYTQGAAGSDNSPPSESLVQELSERERLIVEFLNTARYTTRAADGSTERRARASVHPHPAVRPRLHGSTDGANRNSRPTSPPRHGDAVRDLYREPQTEASDSRQQARRQGAPIRIPNPDETMDPQPSITLSWTASPSEMQSEHALHAADSSSSDPSSSGNETGPANRSYGTISRPSANFDYSNTTSDLLPRPRNHQRSRSGHRRLERQESNTPEALHDPPRLSTSELRATVAAERLRRQRQSMNEPPSRHDQREQRYRQQPWGVEQTRSPRWIRSVLNELPDRSMGVGHRDQDPGSTAGIGWGADGRTLYIATVDGIFEYQVNVTDRKTFPVITYR